jgi:hypothetical protein
MKSVFASTIAVLGLLIAVAAGATPKIGDKSIYNVNLSMGSQSMDGKVTFELTAFDATTDAWSQVTTTEFNGKRNIQQSTMSTKDLLTDAMIDDVLANCAAKGGTAETVTSPAGDLPSCAVPVSNGSGTGTVWVAKVPFGYAKWIANRSDGVVVNGVIESFVPGL